MGPTTLAWRRLRARTGRALVCVVGVGIALVLVVMTSAIVAFTTELFEGEIAKYEGQSFVRSRGRAGLAGEEFPPLSSSLDAAVAREMRGTPILFRALAPPPFPSAPPEALAVGVPAGGLAAYLGTDVYTLQGTTTFSADDAAEIVLGPLAHRFFGRPPLGTSVDLAGTSLRVVGLVDAPPSRLRLVLPLAAIPLETAQKIFHQRGAVSVVLVEGAVDPALLARHPGLQVVSQNDMAGSLGAALEGQRQFFSIFQSVAYAIAASVIGLVLAQSVQERRREIGLMRALGASAGYVLGGIVVEAVTLALLGALLAVGVTYAVDAASGLDLLRFAGPGVALPALGGAFAAAVVAAILPAIRALQIDPAETMRHE
jgi:putative ABC transport system permease protein